MHVKVFIVTFYKHLLIVLCSQVPKSTSEWLQKAEDFEIMWNFPNCIGALDGKRILLEAPANSGSLFYDYKQQFSLVLLAVVDARYKFTYIDVGANGRQSDAGVYNKSTISDALERNTLNIPGPRKLPNSNLLTPFVVVADDAFALKTYMLKPYAGKVSDDIPSRIFNYRLNRARRIVENAFGILSSKWRVY